MVLGCVERGSLCLFVCTFFCLVSVKLIGHIYAVNCCLGHDTQQVYTHTHTQTHTHIHTHASILIQATVPKLVLHIYFKVQKQPTIFRKPSLHTDTHTHLQYLKQMRKRKKTVNTSKLILKRNKRERGGGRERDRDRQTDR